MSEPQYQNLLASVSLMTQISSFFWQLSEDNSAIQGFFTPEMRGFVYKMAELISIENCEFVINLALFFFNAVGQQKTPENLEFLNGVMSKVLSFQNGSAQTEFKAKFAQKFKLAVEYKESDDIIDDPEEGDDVMSDSEVVESKVLTNKETEQLKHSQEFKNWLVISKAQSGIIELLEKIADQNPADEYEDDIEEVEDDDFQGNSDCTFFVQNPIYLLFALDSLSGFPHYLNMIPSAEDVIEDLQEKSYRFITSYQYNFKSDLATKICEKLLEFLSLSAHKVGKLSVENASECL